MDYEYRVIPAPRRLKRIKGVSSTAELCAATFADVINAEARQGWEYVRSESLAAEEPAGWFRRAAVVEETMMIFRRPSRARAGALHDADAGEPEPAPLMQERPVLLRRDPDPRPRGEAQGTPPLLRPVPRHGPGDKK